jgi:hypothetical protein
MEPTIRPFVWSHRICFEDSDAGGLDYCHARCSLGAAMARAESLKPARVPPRIKKVLENG